MKTTKQNGILILIMALAFVFALPSCQDNELPEPDEEAELTEVSDIDGNVYNIVQIGDQYWLLENLMVTRFNDGTPIAHIEGNTEWVNHQEAAYSWYDNNQENKEGFGALYNRGAAHSGKLCPTGWHVPTKKDFNDLASFAISMGGYVGNSLREEGYDHWDSPYPVLVFADNKTNFSARGGGMRNPEGEFTEIRKHGYWWHSEGHLDYTTWARRLDYDSYVFPLLGSTEDFGFSVRCIKSE